MDTRYITFLLSCLYLKTFLGIFYSTVGDANIPNTLSNNPWKKFYLFQEFLSDKICQRSIFWWPAENPRCKII